MVLRGYAPQHLNGRWSRWDFLFDRYLRLFSTTQWFQRSDRPWSKPFVVALHATFKCPVLRSSNPPCNTAPARTAARLCDLAASPLCPWRAVYWVARCSRLGMELRGAGPSGIPCKRHMDVTRRCPEPAATRTVPPSRPRTNRRARPPGSREPRPGGDTTYRRLSRVGRAEQIEAQPGSTPGKQQTASCSQDRSEPDSARMYYADAAESRASWMLS